ncbi:bifunctional DNA primase/polymerase [Lactobacillus sp. AN1001]
MNRKQQYNRMRYCVELAKHGYRLFPLVENTKRPTKGQSYKTASNDPETVAGWFQSMPRLNIGLDLSSSGLIVVDIDTHNEISVRDALKALSDKGCKLPTETYIEQTPSAGLHFFYKGKVPSKRVTNFIPSVDLLSDFIVISPSVINGRAYHQLNPDYSFNDILEAPKWLLDVLNGKQVQDYSNSFKRPRTGKKRTGMRLDEIVKGVDSGGRNMWLTKQVGWLISTGAELATAYEITQQINRDYISPPLEDSEVNTIFQSIVRKETEK